MRKVSTERGRRSRTAVALAAVGAMVMSLGAVLMVTSTAQAGETIHKSYVCKYVARPGHDERLQTGQNPIWVDNNSIPGNDGGPVEDGDVFVDRHFKSVVIHANSEKLNPEPGVEACGPSNPPLDQCPDLPGDQDADTPCTMDPTTRDVPQSEESCELGGVRTWTDVYTTEYEYVEETDEWVAQPETGPVVTDEVFTAYTAEELAELCPPILGEQEITPVVTFQDPTCDLPDRTTWSAEFTDIVDYTVTGTPGRGKTVTVSAAIKPAADEEFDFADGAATEFEHTYLTLADLDCIQGTQTSVPTPAGTTTPVVLGTQAAVPSAVAAGVGGADPTDSRIAALLLVSGGMLLLTAGARIGMGRREAGAHKA